MKNNYNKIVLSIFISFALALIMSCKKENKDEIPTPYPQASTKKAYEKKWNITSANALKIAKTTSDPQLLSIEFMLNSYVIIYSNDSIITGDYTQQNESTILLDGVGVLNITHISTGSFNFILTPTGASGIAITAIVANLVASGNNTTALCNTWKLVSGISSDTSYHGIPSYVEGYWTFSEYGTYLVKVDDGDEISYDTGNWNWNNNEQTSFTITLYNNNTFSEIWSCLFSEGNSKMQMEHTEPSYFIRYESIVQ